MARNKPLRLASARALAASAACRRASLSLARAGNGVGFRCGSATGGNVGEFDMFRAGLGKADVARWYRLVGRGSSAAFGCLPTQRGCQAGASFSAPGVID